MNQRKNLETKVDRTDAPEYLKDEQTFIETTR